MDSSRKAGQIRAARTYIETARRIRESVAAGGYSIGHRSQIAHALNLAGEYRRVAS